MIEIYILLIYIDVLFHLFYKQIKIFINNLQF